MIKWLLIIIRAVPAIIFGCIKCEYMAHHKDKYSLEVRYKAIRKMVIAVNRATRSRMNIEGKEIINAPHDGRIYICNHVTVYETMLLVELSERPLIFLTKIENKKVPFLSTAIKCADAILIDRKDLRQSLKACKQAGELCKEKGYDVALFPEGTRSKDGNVHEFKAALASVIHYSHKEIVMVCMHNAKKPLKWRYITYPREFVDIKIFEPESYESYLQRKKEFSEYSRNKIQTQLDEFKAIERKKKNEHN